MKKNGVGMSANSKRKYLNESPRARDRFYWVFFLKKTKVLPELDKSFVILACIACCTKTRMLFFFAI